MRFREGKVPERAIWEELLETYGRIPIFSVDGVSFLSGRVCLVRETCCQIEEPIRSIFSLDIKAIVCGLGGVKPQTEQLRCLLLAAVGRQPIRVFASRSS